MEGRVLPTQQLLDAASRRRKRQRNLEGYAFIAPAGILIAVFGLFPVAFTLFVSAHRWRLRRGEFLGLGNYEYMFGTLWIVAIIAASIVLVVLAVRYARGRYPGLLRVASGFLAVAAAAGILYGLARMWAAGDDDMLDSLRVTIWYSLGAVPVQLAFGLLLAFLLDQNLKGRQVFRVVYLLPYIVPTVASAAVFQVLFALRPESFANQVLSLFGHEPLAWLGEREGVFALAFGWGAAEPGGILRSYLSTWAQGPSLALVSILFFNYWVYIGYYALIYANGLSNIPRQLYEAAEVDGARKSTVLARIVIPLLSPTTYFLTLLGIIGTFKAFNSIYVLRNPSIGGAVDPMSVYIFFTFFRRSRFGYAAALSLVLFLFVLGLTLIQRRVLERRVHYGD